MNKSDVRRMINYGDTSKNLCLAKDKAETV